MPKVSYATVMRDWELLLGRVTANAADLPFIGDYHAQLETELTGLKESIERQTALISAAQQQTRVVEGFLQRGNVLAVNMKAGIRTRYGNRSDKLVEFGMRPVRRRRVTAEAKRKRKEEKEKAAPQTATTAEPQSQ